MTLLLFITPIFGIKFVVKVNEEIFVKNLVEETHSC